MMTRLTFTITNMINLLFILVYGACVYQMLRSVIGSHPSDQADWKLSFAEIILVFVPVLNFLPLVTRLSRWSELHSVMAWQVFSYVELTLTKAHTWVKANVPSWDL